MSDTQDKISQEVRSFFKSIKWKKILTFSFFVLLATIFWLMQIWRKQFDATLTIPVRYVNVPDSIIFENELPLSMSARIRDDGAALLRYYFTRKNDSMQVNIRELIEGTQEKDIQGRSFEQLLRGKLFSSTELLSYSPTRSTYTYAILREKKLPVIYDGYINLASGYLLNGELEINPDSVIAYGSKAALDTLFYAHTVDDTLANVLDDKKISVNMRSTKGIKFIPSKVELSIPVDKFTEKEIEVPVTCVNLPENLDIKFFPSSVKIPIFVGLKRSHEITADQFRVTVDYDEIKDLKDSSIPVRITESPDYIQTKVPIPSEIEFVLEQK